MVGPWIVDGRCGFESRRNHAYVREVAVAAKSRAFRALVAMAVAGMGATGFPARKFDRWPYSLHRKDSI